MSYNIDLSGRVALVTGASSGLGAQFARTLAKAGAAVVLSARRVERLKTLRAEIEGAGGDAHVVAMDVSDPVSIRAGVAHAETEVGTLDILVNNAAFVRHAPLAHTQTKAWKKSLEVTLDGTFYGLRAALQVMLPRRTGVILNITSGAGLGGEPFHNAYGAAKAAIHNLTALACVENAGEGVRVNAICPGPIDTDTLRSALEQRPGGLAHFVEQIPARRLGAADDVASCAVFLASDEAAYVNGAVLTVDGGISARTGAPR